MIDATNPRYTPSIRRPGAITTQCYVGVDKFFIFVLQGHWLVLGL